MCVQFVSNVFTAWTLAIHTTTFHLVLNKILIGPWTKNNNTEENRLEKSTKIHNQPNEENNTAKKLFGGK